MNHRVLTFGLAITLAAAGVSALPASAGSEEWQISKSTLDAFASGSAEEQQRIYESLSAAQQHALITPVSLTIGVRYTDSEGTTAQDVQENIPVTGASSSAGPGPLQLADMARRCSPGYYALYGWIWGENAFGMRLWRWNDYTNFKFNCTAVTAIPYHDAFGDSTAPLWRWDGEKATMTKGGVGTPYAYSQSIGVMKFCIHVWVVDQCVQSAYPRIHWDLTGVGGWRMTATA